MFQNQQLNHRTNIHKRALGLVYKGYIFSFDELLVNDNSFRTHHCNLQKLAVKIFKVKLRNRIPLANSRLKLNAGYQKSGLRNLQELTFYGNFAETFYSYFL